MGCASGIAEQQQKHQQQQQHQVSFDFVMYQHLQKKSESLTEVWFCVIWAMYFVGAPFLRERERINFFMYFGTVRNRREALHHHYQNLHH